jgi:hypothetical protein
MTLIHDASIKKKGKEKGIDEGISKSFQQECGKGGREEDSSQGPVGIKS